MQIQVNICSIRGLNFYKVHLSSFICSSILILQMMFFWTSTLSLEEKWSPRVAATLNAIGTDVKILLLIGSVWKFFFPNCHWLKDILLLFLCCSLLFWKNLSFKGKGRKVFKYISRVLSIQCITLVGVFDDPGLVFIYKLGFTRMYIHRIFCQ